MSSSRRADLKQVNAADRLAATRRRGEMALKITMMVGGLILLVAGALIAAQGVGTLLLAGAASPILASVAGLDVIFSTFSGYFWAAVGGTVMALVGLGFVVASFNLRSRPQHDPSLTS